MVKMQREQQQQRLNDVDRFDSLSAFSNFLWPDETNENETTLTKLVSSGDVYVRWRAQRLREHFFYAAIKCAHRALFFKPNRLNLDS